MNESEEPQVVPDYQSPGSDSDEEAFRHTRVRHSSLDLTTNTTVKMVVGGLIGATPVRQPMAVPGSPPVQPLANDTSPNSSGVRPLSVHNTPEEQPGPRTWRVPRDSPSAARAARAAFYGGAADSADALASSSLLWTSTSGTFGENSVLSPLPSVHQVGGGPVAQSAETSPNPEYDPHVASEGRGMRKSMSYSISITEADKALSQNGSSGNSGGPNSARLGESKSADSLRDDQPYSDSNRDLMQGFHDATRFARSAESSPMVRGARTMNMGDESSPESRASAPLYNPSPNSSASHSSPMPSSGSDELLSTRRLPPSHDPSPNSSSTSSHSLPPSPQSTGAESLGQRARPLPAMSMPPSHSGSTSSQARPFTVLSLQRPLSLCAAPSTLGVLLTSGPLFAQAQSLPLDAMTISVRGEPVQVVNVLRSEVSSRCYFVASVRAGGGPRSRGPTAALTADSPGVIAEQGASPGESSLAFTVSIVPELVELQLSLRRSDLAACASFGMVDFNCAAEVSLQSAAGLSFSTWTCTGKFSKTRVRPSVAADTSPESGSKATVMGWVLTDVLVELRRGTSSLPNTPYATATTATPSPLDAPASAGYVVPELYFPEAAMHDVPPHAQHHHQVHQRQAQYAPRSAGGSHVPHHQHHLQHQHAYMHEDPYAMAGGYGEYPARMPPRALPGHMAHMHHHQAGSYAPYGNPVMRGHGQWAPQSPYDYPNADPHMNGLPLAPSGSMSGPGTPRTPGGSVMRRPHAHGHGHGHRLSPGFGGGHPHGPRHSRSRGATPQTSPAVRHRQLRGGGGGGGGAGGDGDGGNSPAVYPLPPKAAEYRQLNPLIDLINEMMASGTPWPEPAEDPILSHIVGRVVLVAKSQCGSRFLQERITQGSSAYLELVYAETFEQFGQLMLDLFGNYLCQAVVEKCSDEQRTRLLVHLRNDIPRISHDRQGTRAVQKLVSTSRGSAEQRRHVTDSVRRNLLHLIMDPNASHVVHALLDHYPRDELDFVFAEALSALPKLAVDQHGLCVLKSCITLASAEDFVRFADAIVEHVLDLVNNEYGNYIVQHLIEQKDTACNSRVDARLRGNYGSLAQRKFSSNVVEKCLRLADRTWRQAILGELLDASTLAQVLRDSYGNFVLQNALFVANDDERRHLIELVHPHVPSLRKNLRRKWQRLISEANAGTLDPSAYQRTRNAKSGKHNSHRGNGRGRRRSGPGGPRAPRPDMRVNGDSASYNGNGGRHAHNHNSQRGHSDRGGRGRRSGAGRRRQQRGRRY